MLPWPRPPPILVLNVVFGKLVSNPSCVPNLKLLASAVAEINSIWCVNHMNVKKTAVYCRLRGSASTVLTATGQVKGRWRIFYPSQNRNPWADCNKILHNWLRQWDDPLSQIWYKSFHWGLLGIWVKYYVLVPFLFIYTFFSETRVQVRPVDGVLRAIAH